MENYSIGEIEQPYLNQAFSNAHGKGWKKLKKRLNDLKNLPKKAAQTLRNKARKIIRRKILSLIRHNVHGIATRAYPAVAYSDADLKQRGYKTSFISKAKNAYAELVSEWKKIGGNESDLKAAILKGSNKRMLQNPYSNTAAAISSSVSKGIGGHFSKVEGDSIEYDTSDEFYNWLMDTFSNADDDSSDDSSGDDAAAKDLDSTGTDADNTNIDPKDTKKGLKGIIAKILSIFKKHKADEIPLDESTPAGQQMKQDDSADKKNQPSASEANNDATKELDGNADEDKPNSSDDPYKGKSEDPDAKFLGFIPMQYKWFAIGGAGLLVTGIFIAVIVNVSGKKNSVATIS